MRKPDIAILLPAILFGILTALSTPSAAGGEDGPLTVAEKTDFAATSTHADVMDFIAQLKIGSPLIKIETMAVTVEGREVPLVIIGDPAPASPAALRYDDRAAVYIQANIHAGEVEGKEAALMLARDIVQGATPDYLDRLVILLAPNFNPDGNDKISVENRTRQHGPERGVGIRYNGQGLDLNRDAIKLETPEVTGLVDNVLNRWDPIFFLDSHTHNGSYHKEPVTWAWGLNPNGDRLMISYMEKVVLPAITRIMKEDYGLATIPHGDFLDARRPEKGWVAHAPICRYLVNYVGLRNRFSVLNEQYPYVDFETRVRGAYSLFRAFLDFIHEHKDEMVRLAAGADGRAMSRGAAPSAEDEFVVEYERVALEEKLDIEGWEMEVEEREGTWPRVTKTDRDRTYKDVPYFARYEAERAIPYARGYLIAANVEAVRRNLLMHGIAVERLMEPATVAVEGFVIEEVTGSDRPNQGHYTTSVSGHYEAANVEFPAGALYVSTAQPLGPLAAFLLEAESGDGLLFWNFFDRYLVPQWGRGQRTYPVYRVLHEVELPTSIIVE